MTDGNKVVDVDVIHDALPTCRKLRPADPGVTAQHTSASSSTTTSPTDQNLHRPGPAAELASCTVSRHQLQPTTTQAERKQIQQNQPVPEVISAPVSAAARCKRTFCDINTSQAAPERHQRLIPTPGQTENTRSTASQAAAPPPEYQARARRQRRAYMDAAKQLPPIGGDVPFPDDLPYAPVRCLRSDHRGSLWECIDKQTRHKWAIKFMDVNISQDKFMKGIINLRALYHPHIIGFREVLAVQGKFLALVMEYASGPTLFNYVRNIGRLKEPAARWLFQQLILALDYCHKRGIVHRNIKLENCLLQPEEATGIPTLKLCGFTYSKNTLVPSKPELVGTLAYMAPEIIRDAAPKPYDAKAADIWSCGVALYVMLFGTYPFPIADKPNSIEAQRQAMQGGGYQLRFPEDAAVSAECRQLLSSMLTQDPVRRASRAHVMHHPWFQSDLPEGATKMNGAYLELEVENFENMQKLSDVVQVLIDAGDYFKVYPEDVMQQSLEKEGL